MLPWFIPPGDGRETKAGKDMNRCTFIRLMAALPALAFQARDAGAVAVYWRENRLGYIPRADNMVIANLMDQGWALDAFIDEKRLRGNPWERVELVS